MSSRALFTPLSLSDYMHEAAEATHESRAWLQEQAGEEKGTITILILVLIE